MSKKQNPLNASKQEKTLNKAQERLLSIQRKTPPIIGEKHRKTKNK
jgi:hypothetical protein